MLRPLILCSKCLCCGMVISARSTDALMSALNEHARYVAAKSLGDVEVREA